jgi:hypothetical protein
MRISPTDGIGGCAATITDEFSGPLAGLRLCGFSGVIRTRTSIAPTGRRIDTWISAWGASRG